MGQQRIQNQKREISVDQKWFKINGNSWGSKLTQNKIKGHLCEKWFKIK